VDAEETGDEHELFLLPLHVDDDLEPRLASHLARIASDPEPYRRLGLVPFFVSDDDLDAAESTEEPRETRLLPSWWGILPGDRYPPGVREAYRELLRLLRPELALRFRVFENHALAGIDLYAQALADRPPVASPETKGKPLVLVVCGIDGSGKSSHVEALREHLEARGLSCAVHKIYRHGVFHDTVTDLTRRCAGGKDLHLWRIQRLAKAFDSLKYLHRVLAPDLKRHDVILLDRYVYTHFTAGTGRYHHDPYTHELLSAFPRADRVFLLDLPAEDAWKRIEARDERTVDENPYMLDRFRQGLLDLADRHGFRVLSSRDPFEENAAAIRADVETLLAESEGGES
jgi:dTMP kinase